MLAGFLQNMAMATTDGVQALIPRSLPDLAALRACKIIAHRGEHQPQAVIENTLEAFDLACDAGVWGLEVDIRWSRDLVPLVVHDPCGTRLFGDSGCFAELDFAEIRHRMPMVLSLQELIDRYGSRVHLMLEIKDDPYPAPSAQEEILRGHLSGLQPGRDFHLLALDPALFERAGFVPRSCCFPVAELNVGRLSRASLEGGYGGLTGHYVLLGKQLKAAHEAQGQSIGTGFPGSRNALYRELNRGVHWIFTNHAVRLQRYLDAAIELREA